MATHIEMPKLSDTMTEGTVVRWLKSVGDEVEIGDEIAEIETDKATMAMEAFDEGILSEILIEEGGKAEVGATLAVLREEGETVPSPDSSNDEAPAPDPEPVTEVPLADPEPVEAAEHVPASIPSSPPESPPQDSPVTSVASGRVKASPLARKIAEQEGVDLSGLKGSGPGGRIVKKDVEAALAVDFAPAGPAAVSSPAPTPTPTPAPAPAPAPAPGN